MLSITWFILSPFIFRSNYNHAVPRGGSCYCLIFCFCNGLGPTKLCRSNNWGCGRLHSAPGGGIKYYRIYWENKEAQEKWDGQQTHVNQKGFGGLYLVAPCGNDNDHLESKRTTIHLNPGLPGKTHNPRNTHDPSLDRQQGKNGTLEARDKTIRAHFSHSLQTQRDYLTFHGIGSICSPALIPSFTKSSPLHLWDYVTPSASPADLPLPSLLLSLLVLQSD